MTDDQRHIAQAILDAIAKAPGVVINPAPAMPHGGSYTPGIRTGDLYVAFHKKGVHLTVFLKFMADLLSTGKVLLRGDFYQLPVPVVRKQKEHGHG